MPLSERIIFTSLRPKINGLSDNKNESVVRSLVSSKWSARVSKQAKITPLHLAFAVFDLVRLENLNMIDLK